MRCYVPMTLPLLRDAWSAGSVPAGERVRAEGDDEEAEYAALQEAADLSAGLLEGPTGRRVVLVAEAPDLDGPIALRHVVAVHVDTEPVDPGDDDPPELGWFATQEVPGLLAD